MDIYHWIDGSLQISERDLSQEEEDGGEEATIAGTLDDEDKVEVIVFG